MSYLDAFNKGRTMARQITGQNPLGSGAAIGSSPTIGKKKRPQTMQEWKTFADGLTRRERDQLYPGMHIDLIPAYEMITGGDPNWGAEGGSELSKSFDNTEQVGVSKAAGQYIRSFDDGEEEEYGPEGGEPRIATRYSRWEAFDTFDYPVRIFGSITTYGDAAQGTVSVKYKFLNSDGKPDSGESVGGIGEVPFEFEAGAYPEVGAESTNTGWHEPKFKLVSSEKATHVMFKWDFDPVPLSEMVLD